MWREGISVETPCVIFTCGSGIKLIAQCWLSADKTDRATR